MTSEKIKTFEHSDLPDDQKAALRLCDAFLIDPGDAGADLRAALFEHYSPTQVLELTLRMGGWSMNKRQVALSIDAPFKGTEMRVRAEDGTRISGPELDHRAAAGG